VQIREIRGYDLLELKQKTRSLWNVFNCSLRRPRRKIYSQNAAEDGGLGPSILDFMYGREELKQKHV